MSGNVDTVRTMYRDFENGNVPGVVQAMDPKIEWTEAEGFPYAGTYVGPDAVLAGVFARLGSEWDGYQAAPEEFLDAGDAVVALGMYSGRQRMPQTGEPRARGSPRPDRIRGRQNSSRSNKGSN